MAVLDSATKVQLTPEEAPLMVPLMVALSRPRARAMSTV